MTCSRGSRDWRARWALGWFALVGASLLGTSPPDDGVAQPRLELSQRGPVVTLSDGASEQSYLVTVLAPPRADGETWTLPESALVSLEAKLEHTGGEGSQYEPPWVVATLADEEQTTLAESSPVLSEWRTTAGIEFLGDCAEPDPNAADPCRLSLVVHFDRFPTGDESALSNVFWDLNFEIRLGGSDAADDPSRWPVEIEPP